MAAALVPFLSVALPGAAEPDTPPELDPFPHPKGYVCHRARSPITIDGMAEAAWDAAPWTDPFVDIEGDKKPVPPLRTRVKMLWDDEALYVLAEIEDPNVWATLTAHDSVIFHDNDFELFLDPDGDNHLYAELEVNALNTTWDLLLPKPYKDGGRAVNAWEIAGLKTAVRVDGTLNTPGDRDRGWAVEIRWPWAGLGELTRNPIPPRDGDQWRINFSRVEWEVEVAGGKYQKVKGRPEHNWVWSPQGLIDMHRPERWGYLQFSSTAPGKTEFRPDPDWPVRDLLHRVYYAQRAYQKSNGKYAPATGPLGVTGASAPLAGPVTIETTTGGFEAGITRPAGRGEKPRRLSITHEGQFRNE
ncbi:MAG: hypothetical protein JWO38_954 [Gemmataceae bacterium]|nr:hypothetical protein [Gemmataceae bacterium]